MRCKPSNPPFVDMLVAFPCIFHNDYLSALAIDSAKGVWEERIVIIPDSLSVAGIPRFFWETYRGIGGTYVSDRSANSSDIFDFVPRIDSFRRTSFQGTPILCTIDVSIIHITCLTYLPFAYRAWCASRRNWCFKKKSIILSD